MIGSVLAIRFTGRMTSTLAPCHLPQAVEGRILGSVSGALGVAARVGGSTGALLSHAARVAFISGMDLGLAIGAAAALAGAIIGLAALPARPSSATSGPPGTGGSPGHADPPGHGDPPAAPIPRMPV